MPRSPNEKKQEAEKLFKKGYKLTDIAKKLEVSEGTVRSWKSRGKWEGGSKKNKRSVADDKRNAANKSATLQKKKRGAPKGNKNAVGNRGNPNPNPPPDRTKHGGYSVPYYWDALDSEEQDMILENADNGVDEEGYLLYTIDLLAIRERRLLKAINIYRKKEEEEKASLYVSSSTVVKNSRDFKDEKEKRQYDDIIEAKVKKGDRLPGEQKQITTQTSATIDLITRLERELSTVTSNKTKAIAELAKLHMERAKMENEASGGEELADWIASTLEGDLNG